MMRTDNYIVVLSWMMTALGLSGNDLLCYALIYGYSQNGAGGYFGTRTHLAESLNIARRTATDVLNRLVDKGAITVQPITVDGVARCMYRAVVPAEADEASPPVMPPASSPPAKRKFAKPTRDEVREYCRERGNAVNADLFYDHYEANGWVQRAGKPIRDWKAAIRTWEQNDITSKPQQYGQATDKGGYASKEAILQRRREEILNNVEQANAEYRARMVRAEDSGGLFESV